MYLWRAVTSARSKATGGGVHEACQVVWRALRAPAAHRTTEQRTDARDGLGLPSCRVNGTG